LQAIDLVRAASPGAAAGASLIAVIDVCDRLDGTGPATCLRRWAFDSYVVLVSRPVVLVSRPVGSEVWQVFTVVGERGPERAAPYDGTLPKRLVHAIEDLLATPAVLRFSSNVLSFEHPGPWRESGGSAVLGTPVQLRTYLASMPLDPPCAAHHCTTLWPMGADLGPGDIMAGWFGWSFVGVDYRQGLPMTVGGHDAWWSSPPVDAVCAAQGGDHRLKVTVENGPNYDWEEFDACYRDPSGQAGIEDAIRAMLATVRWTSDR